MVDFSYVFIAFSVVCWVCLIALIGRNGSVCSAQYNYESWVYFACFGQICLFFSNVLQAIPRLAKQSHEEYLSSLHVLESASVAVMLIAGISSILQFVKWDNICPSLSSRFYLPASLWIEWLICLPLMAFISVFVDDIWNISLADVAFIVLLGLSILFGFASSFGSSSRVKAAMIVLSFVAYGVGALLVFIPKIKKKKYNTVETDVEAAVLETRKLQRLRVSIHDTKLGQLLMFVLPPFPIIYLLGDSGILSSSQTYVAFIGASAIAKYIYMLAATGIHSTYLQSQLEAMQRAEHAASEKVLKSEQAASDARRKFLRFVFHEVRVPLNSITMGISVLQENDDLDVVRDTLMTMDLSATFMTDTLNEVLSMQKIEEGKLELMMKFFSVREMVSRLLSTFEAMLGSKQLPVDFVGFVPDIAKGDRFRIEHVIANLLSNAIKFSPDDGVVSLTIRYEKEELGAFDTATGVSRKGVFVFSVTDNGLGMSEDEMQGLFTPFHQIRPHETQRGQGTGLGLLIARDTISLHGGDLTCVSEPGRGSTFSVQLPMEVSESSNVEDNEAFDLPAGKISSTCQAVGTTADPVIAVSGACQARSSRVEITSLPDVSYESVSDLVVRIDPTLLPAHYIQQPVRPNLHHVDHELSFADRDFLIVDDTESNSKMLQFLLNKRSVRSSVAVNGAAALACVEANPHRYSLVFMDNTMPVMDGVQATRKLRGDLRFENLIIGVTGNALDDDVAAFLAAGADMVLAKPLRLHQLDALLGHCASHGYLSSPAHKLAMLEPASRINCRIARTNTKP